MDTNLNEVMMTETNKYVNVPAYCDNHYWSVDSLRELKKFFASRAIIWESGLDVPNVAEKAAYQMFKGAMSSI